jgi:putative DNA primase/helicase
MGKEQGCMMHFQDFAQAHGINISRLQDDGKWHRVPTETHPKKKNGAYRYCGTHGHIQDHAQHIEPILWTPTETELAKIDHAGIARRAQEAANEIRRGQEAAAKRAAWIMHQCEQEPHAYLESKGFPKECVNVWIDEKAGDRKMVVPMRIDGQLVGAQTISDQPGFEKRFLFGQRTSGATYVIDNKGPSWYCEGYATGLSVRAALQALKTRYRLVICFSAANLLRVAKQGFVVADFDHPSPVAPLDGGMGVKIATETGLPFWSAGKLGYDFNDHAREVGVFKASQELRVLMMRC